MNRGVVITA